MDGEGEVADLARTFNQMADSIQSNDNSRGQFMGNNKLYYKAFKSYQKILEKDGQPDDKISSEVDAETEENMAVLDEEVEELT